MRRSLSCPYPLSIYSYFLIDILVSHPHEKQVIKYLWEICCWFHAEVIKSLKYFQSKEILWL